VKYNTFDFFIDIYFFFFNSATGHTPQRILTRDGSNDAFSPKEVPFGVKKLKLTLNPFYSPKGQILAKKWTWKIFGRKSLNNGDAQE